MPKITNLVLFTFMLVSTPIVSADESTKDGKEIQTKGQTIVLPNPQPFSQIPSALSNCIPSFNIEDLENKARLKRAYYKSLIKEGFSKDEAFEILMREHILFN